MDLMLKLLRTHAGAYGYTGADRRSAHAGAYGHPGA